LSLTPSERSDTENSDDTETHNTDVSFDIKEGEAVQLDASALTSSDGGGLTFTWDLNNDSVFGDVTGKAPKVDWETLKSFSIDDDGPYYPISLKVGLDVWSAKINVSNTPPTLKTTGADTVKVGQDYVLSLKAVDPGNDTIRSWTINWGDGAIETFAGNPASVTHVYSNLGFTNNILASAVDEDGTHLQNELVVASSATDKIIWYDTTGTPRLQAGGGEDYLLDYPVDVIVGPDGNLYVAGSTSENIVSYDATDGTFVTEFVMVGMSGAKCEPGGMALGPDGRLYVACYETGEVLRYDAATGEFVDVFVTPGLEGLFTPEGLIFGPDGDLYVGAYEADEVYRYDGMTGMFVDIFVTAGLGSLNGTEDIAFGPDGHLYVASNYTHSVLRYDGLDGSFIDRFVSSGDGNIDYPAGLGFGPDGHLYVGSWGSDAVLRFDGATGAFIDTFVPTGAGGLRETYFFAFIPQQQVHVIP
jgi:streptogramin lyase